MNVVGAPSKLYDEYERRSNNLSIVAVTVIAIIVVAGIVGNIYTFQLSSRSVRVLENKVASLQTQISALEDALGSYNETSLGNITLSELYENIIDSVVLIRGYVVENVGLNQQISEVAGSGFVYNVSGRMVINTNFHVVEDTVGLTVTFRNGNSYSATILGADPYVDFAVLSADAPPQEFRPLSIVTSSLLRLGDLVIAIGNPYGLTGTMTSGIVSQLGRTITEPGIGAYPIADVIQISTPINPGNSGGPLLNSKGQVVGITTAVITDSEGIGFAIPSDTLLREVDTLASGMTYDHPWIGVSGIDMTYEIAKAMNANVTYGWLIVDVMKNSPAEKAGLKGATGEVEVYGQTVPIGGDVILEINGTLIINGDDVSRYLGKYTSPRQTIYILVERDGVERYTVTIPLELGFRPAPS